MSVARGGKEWRRAFLERRGGSRATSRTRTRQMPARYLANGPHHWTCAAFLICDRRVLRGRNPRWSSLHPRPWFSFYLLSRSFSLSHGLVEGSGRRSNTASPWCCLKWMKLGSVLARIGRALGNWFCNFWEAAKEWYSYPDWNCREEKSFKIRRTS